jgi:uncharacterized protein YfaA (DUF2138 family)
MEENQAIFPPFKKYVHQGRMQHFKIDSAAVFCKSMAAIGSSCVVFPFFKRASNMRLEHISDEFANFGWWRVNLQVNLKAFNF